MKTYIVRDKDGRIVYTRKSSTPSMALASAFYEAEGVPTVDELMLAAGYTVKEVPEMIEVPFKDLEEVIGVFYENDTPARDRLRTLVEKHRSGKP